MKATPFAIDRVDPPHWYVGMRNSTLQLMVYGKRLDRVTKVSVSPAQGVCITEMVRCDSPDYLLIYVDVAGAAPRFVNFSFHVNTKVYALSYELRQRDMEPTERHGFTSADVLYMLMPDRFSDGDSSTDVVCGMRDQRCDRSKPSLRHGGDLKGIENHLDYFTDLGVTALWLTPVLENDMPSQNDSSSYHGYAITDYYRIDPRFGTNSTYRQLVDACHKYHLKMVMDMIFNHCGLFHPWLKNKPMADWFNHPDCKHNYVQTNNRLTPVMDPYASQVDLDETVNGWFVPHMPDLNQRNRHVARYLVQTSKWWIEYAGIDGIRMDTYPYADYAAMAAWMKELKEEYPNFNVVGETWVTDSAYTAAWQKGSKCSIRGDSHLDVVMDFALFERIGWALHEETDGWFSGLNRVYHTLCYDYLYTDPSNVLAFVENHDTDRFLGDGSDILLLKQAYALLLTIPRIPQLYYGSEILMNGTKTKTDGDVRRDFYGGWSDDLVNCFNPVRRSLLQNEMYDYTRRLLHFRKSSRAVTEGSMTHFIPHDGVYVYVRSKDGERVMVILNGTSHSVNVDMSRYAEAVGDVQTGRDVVTRRRISLRGCLVMKGRESLVLRL